MNNCEDLKKSIASIRGFTNYSFRIIIIDSSRGNEIRDFATVLQDEFLCKYFWQKPKGVYSAMNEGLVHADENHMIWFLNPGDTLESPEVLNNLLMNIEKSGASWGYCQAIYDDPNTSVFPSSELTAKTLLQGSEGISHQAMVVAGGILKKLDGFNSQYRIVSDFELQFKLLKNFQSFFLPQVMVRIDINGISHKSLIRTYWESHLVRFRSVEMSPAVAIFFSLKLLTRRLFRSLRRKLLVP